MKKQNCRARNTNWQTLLDKNRKFSGKLIQTLKFITSWFMCINKLFEKKTILNQEKRHFKDLLKYIFFWYSRDINLKSN